jgi:hypothetical protein
MSEEMQLDLRKLLNYDISLTLRSQQASSAKPQRHVIFTGRMDINFGHDFRKIVDKVR